MLPSVDNAALFQRTRSDTIVSTGLDYSTCRRVEEDALSSLVILQLPRSALHAQSMSEYQSASIPVDSQHDEGFDFSTAKSIAKYITLEADSSVEASWSIWSMGQNSDTDVRKSRRSTEPSMPILKSPTQHRSSSPSNEITVSHNDSDELSYDLQSRRQKCPTTEAVCDHTETSGQHAGPRATLGIKRAKNCSETPQALHSEIGGGQTQRIAQYTLDTHQFEERGNLYAERIPSSYLSTTSSDTFPQAMIYRDVAKGEEVDFFLPTCPRQGLPITMDWSSNVGEEASLNLAKRYKSVRDVPMIAKKCSRKRKTYFLNRSRDFLVPTDRSFRWDSLSKNPSSRISPHEETSTLFGQCSERWCAITLDNTERSKRIQAIFRRWFPSPSFHPSHISNRQHTNPTNARLQISKASPSSRIQELPSSNDYSKSNSSAQGSIRRLNRSIRNVISSGSSQSSLIISRGDTRLAIPKEIPLSTELSGTPNTDIYAEKKNQREIRCCIKPIIEKFMSRKL